MNGDPLPDGLSYPDEITYLSLRNVYAALRDHTIDRETAMNEKRKLIDDLRIWNYQADMGSLWVKTIKAVESAATAYRKSRTLENADRLLQAVEGVQNEQQET